MEDIGVEVVRREVVLQLPDGEYVVAGERFFPRQTRGRILFSHGWTSEEAEAMPLIGGGLTLLYSR